MDGVVVGAEPKIKRREFEIRPRQIRRESQQPLQGADRTFIIAKCRRDADIFERQVKIRGFVQRPRQKLCLNGGKRAAIGLATISLRGEAEARAQTNHRQTRKDPSHSSAPDAYQCPIQPIGLLHPLDNSKGPRGSSKGNYPQELVQPA